MQTFDWIVVGNGLAGAALSYELAQAGLSVLLLDQYPQPAIATRYSYGGIPYWSGTTPLTRQLCQEGKSRHQMLSEETGHDTEFRELDLLLTIAPDQDPQEAVRAYASVEAPPQFIDAQEAAALEPQLNAGAIAGALTVRHGHVSPTAMVRAYNQGFQKLGGQWIIAPVTGLVRVGDRVTGVTTPTQAYAAGQVAIAAGAYTRSLLSTIGLKVPVYFTQAEVVETPPVEFTFRTLMMPAVLTRARLENQGGEADAQWDQADRELVPPILDAGLIQFRDRHLCIGQISRIQTTLEPSLDADHSTRQLYAEVGKLVPAIASVPGQWHSCPVAFSGDGLPLVGPVPHLTGVSIFSGFSGPFAYVPSTAVHFAQWASGSPSSVVDALSPQRFVP